MQKPGTILIKLFKWSTNHLELIFWISSITLLYFLPEDRTDTSLCIFSLAGFGHCPGCGLGHSIHYILHLKPIIAFHHHPLGIFAVIVIFRRIYQLIQTKTTLHETQPDQSHTIH